VPIGVFKGNQSLKETEVAWNRCKLHGRDGTDLPNE